MRIIVAGGDGFCGWPTALYLSELGHDVTIVDNLVRRKIDVELMSGSVTPIATLDERVAAWRELTGRTIGVRIGDLNDYEFLSGVFRDVRPEAFVHFAEQRSAPYSMIDREHAVYTQSNNVLGTLNVLYAIKEYAPNCHLVKLGTMGEYGTPNIDIEEGYLTVEHKGRQETFLYPKTPGSFYHLSKVHDTNNIYFACRMWGIRATDLNQGVVYNVRTPQTELDPRLANRFDYDGIFGTALDRFVAQAAVGHPLTVYGRGGQTRGYINILDTVRCLQLACENPPEPGKLRVMNQFTQWFSVNQLAQTVKRVGDGMGLDVTIEHLDNPRIEREDDHYFHAVNTSLISLGLEPHMLDDQTVASILELAIANRDRINQSLICNSPTWK
jgi:UDP-sulfoquinovose synthase